jgi:hypothetical protein
LIGGFLLASILGTFLLNVTLYVVAKNIGFTTEIRYYGVHFYRADYSTCDTIGKYMSQIKAKQHFPGEEKLHEVSRAYSLINSSVLLQNMLIGTIGFILLFLYRKSLKKYEELKIGHWILVFLALFWLTKCFILITWLLHYFLHGKFGYNLWEYIAYYLHVPALLLIVAAGLTGFAILAIIIFRFIPLKQRLTFIISGITSGSLSIGLWLFWSLILAPKITA